MRRDETRLEREEEVGVRLGRGVHDLAAGQDDGHGHDAVEAEPVLVRLPRVACRPRHLRRASRGERERDSPPPSKKPPTPTPTERPPTTVRLSGASAAYTPSQTWPAPMRAVSRAASYATRAKRARDTCTPGVEEKPGFALCPPPLTWRRGSRISESGVSSDRVGNAYGERGARRPHDLQL
jgi:hypothetical protein